KQNTYMKRIIYFTFSLAILFMWSSCRKDFDFSASTGSLQFSKDTVYLDTVFTNIGSSTYNLKVYNKSNEDISIPTLRLGLGENSNYRLNVDGIAGKEFENVEILAKDSMYIFIETTIDIKIYMLSLARISTFSNSLPDRKSTRLNSSHVKSSYAVFCWK